MTRDGTNTRYSALTQINAANVKELRVAFTFALGVERGQEAAPIVVGDTIYLVAPFPVHTGALGALLTLAPTPWYFSYFASAPKFGLDALEDQQLGGLVMWVPASLTYVGCALVLAIRWIAPRHALGTRSSQPTGVRDARGECSTRPFASDVALESSRARL